MAGIHETLSRFDVSGEILSEDTILLLTQPDPKIGGYDSEVEDCAAAFELLSEVWQEIRTEISEFDTEKLRRKWLTPVFDLLGHNLTFLRGHTDFGGRHPIPLTHRSHVDVPVWMLDFDQNVDEKPTEGKNRRSPHEHFQEYLDLTDGDSWGILTNGRAIRLLHDYHKSLTRNFVEVDLANVFESLDFDAFRAVWRIFHAKSFTPGSKGVLPIERLRDFSRQEGTEIGKELRFQVLESIKVLGNGFLQADVSGELAQALREQPNALMTFYRALLRIVYRLLFLLYIDNKPNWTPARDRVWSSSYSISRLKKEAEDAAAEEGKFFFARAHSEDHWEGLKVVFRVIREGSEAFSAKIHPYGGDLFAEESLWLLRDAPLYNQDLLKAIRLLTIFERKSRGKKGQVYRVNFRNLRIDALGSVYEALLDIAPVLNEDGSFDFGDGAERKLSGTYYTPPALVSEIVKTALFPVIEDRLAGVDESDQEAALLNIKVVDPACGSGAFLIQAMDALAARLCDIRYQGEPPTDEQLRVARRDVVTKCIHGVDLNPMAVELCKFTLWLHVAHPELPLSYLEPVIVCGNALVGVPLKAQVEHEKTRLATEQELVRKRPDLTPAQRNREFKKLRYIGWPDSIPDEAFTPVTGDDPKVARAIKRRNKEEREGQLSLPFHREQTQEQLRTQKYLKFKQLSEDNIEAQRQKRELYERWRSDEDTRRRLFEADLWCSAFFWPLHEEKEAPTHERFREVKEQNANAQPVDYWDSPLTETVRALAHPTEPGSDSPFGHGFFHWEEEFPDVFAEGGFDCIIGNPPWDILQADDIGQPSTELPRYQKWFEKGFYSEISGRRDLYKLFLARSRTLLRQSGQMGLVVPLGWLFEEDCVELRRLFFELGSVPELIHCQNGRKSFFGDVDSRYRFCGLRYTPRQEISHTFSYVVKSPDSLRSRGNVEVHRSAMREVLGEQLEAALFDSASQYQVHSQLIGALRGLDRLEYSVVAEFHASTDKELVHPYESEIDWALLQNKNIHYFNHVFAPCERAVSQEHVHLRLLRKGLDQNDYGPGSSRLVFRDICRNDDTRTLIACLVPSGYVSTYDTPMLVPLNYAGEDLKRCLLRTCGFLSTFVADFLVRPYIDKHLKGYVLKRVPIPDLMAHPAGQQIEDVTRSLVQSQFQGDIPAQDDHRIILLNALVSKLAGCSTDDLHVLFNSFESMRNDETSRLGEYRTLKLVLDATTKLSELQQ